MSKRMRTPKRKVVKYVKFFNTTLANGTTEDQCFVADRDLTLVRTIIQGDMIYTSNTAGFNAVQMIYSILPRGQTICETPSIADQDWDYVPDEQIANFALAQGGDQDGGTTLARSFEWDIKGQRKLKDRDQLTTKWASGSVNAAVVYVITMFFKET